MKQIINMIEEARNVFKSTLNCCPRTSRLPVGADMAYADIIPGCCQQDPLSGVFRRAIGGDPRAANYPRACMESFGCF